MRMSSIERKISPQCLQWKTTKEEPSLRDYICESKIILDYKQLNKKKKLSIRALEKRLSILIIEDNINPGINSCGNK